MGTMIVTLLVLLIFVLLMSIGVIFGRKPIAGSCGGMGKALGEKDYVCGICGGDESKCEEKQKSTDTNKTENTLAYEVKFNKNQ